MSFLIRKFPRGLSATLKSWRCRNRCMLFQMHKRPSKCLIYCLPTSFYSPQLSVFLSVYQVAEPRPMGKTLSASRQPMRALRRHLTGETDSAKVPRRKEEIAANGRQIFLRARVVAAYQQNVVGWGLPCSFPFFRSFDFFLSCCSVNKYCGGTRPCCIHPYS